MKRTELSRRHFIKVSIATVAAIALGDSVLLPLIGCRPATQPLTTVPTLTLPETIVPALTPIAPGTIPTPAATIPVPAPTPALTTPDPASIPVPGPNEVWIQGNEYRPSVITIPAGATVTWIAKDDNDTEHDVDSDDGLFFRSLAMGGSFSYTFTERGTFYYSCGCNPPMGGAVIVE